MKLVFGPLRADRPTLESRWDALLGVVADFSILVRGRCLLHEEMFPVVELAASLRHWLDDFDRGVIGDFSYESMESAQGPLLQFLKRDGGWNVRSPLQEHEEQQVLTTDEIRSATSQFVEEIRRAAATQLGLDVPPTVLKAR